MHACCTHISKGTVLTDLRVVRGALLRQKTSESILTTGLRAAETCGPVAAWPQWRVCNKLTRRLEWGGACEHWWLPPSLLENSESTMLTGTVHTSRARRENGRQTDLHSNTRPDKNACVFLWAQGIPQKVIPYLHGILLRRATCQSKRTRQTEVVGLTAVGCTGKRQSAKEPTGTPHNAASFCQWQRHWWARATRKIPVKSKLFWNAGQEPASGLSWGKGTRFEFHLHWEQPKTFNNWK